MPGIDLKLDAVAKEKTEPVLASSRRMLKTAVLFTLVTTVLLGLGYPLAVTGLAKLLFRSQANGSLIVRDNQIVGSRLLGQAFTGDKYFHSRPSAAGNGYDAANSGGSNYGPTNQKLLDRVAGDVAAAQKDHPGQAVPIDLVTASGSGLDPDISPAAAEWQVDRVAKARGISADAVRSAVARHTSGRQFGFFGEPRVNVLELNLDLDGAATQK
jgi:K+-transporting ATPase ATPase C chain